jgi:hypothetical protein
LAHWCFSFIAETNDLIYTYMQLTKLTEDDLADYSYWGDVERIAENGTYYGFKFKDRAVQSNSSLAGYFLLEHKTGKVYQVASASQVHKHTSK